MRRALVGSLLHRPYLGATAFRQALQYRRAAATVGHTPKVLCIGNFKTGSVSLHGLLSQKLHGAHEPQAYLFAKQWLRQSQGQISQDAWSDFLIRRANTLKLDFECAGFLTTEAETLAKIFPHTKFVLTIREPKSWLDSMLRHIAKNRHNLGCHYWEPVLQEWFNLNGPVKIPPNEAEVEGMLQYWLRSNQAAIDAISSDRRLILDTKTLTASVGQLEAFMGWSENSLDRSKAHLHRGSKTPKVSKSGEKNYYGGNTFAECSQLYSALASSG